MRQCLHRFAYEPRKREWRRVLVAVGLAAVLAAGWRVVRPRVVHWAALSSIGSSRVRLLAEALRQKHAAFPADEEFWWNFDELLARMGAVMLVTGTSPRPGWIGIHHPLANPYAFGNGSSARVEYFDHRLERIGSHLTRTMPASPPVDADGDGSVEVIEMYDALPDDDRRDIAAWAVVRLGVEHNEIVFVALRDYGVWPLTTSKPARFSIVVPIWRDEDGDGLRELVFVTRVLTQDPLFGVGYEPARTVAVFEWSSVGGVLRAREVPRDCGVIGWSRATVGPIWPTVPIGSIASQLFPVPDDFGKPRDGGG